MKYTKFSKSISCLTNDNLSVVWRHDKRVKRKNYQNQIKAFEEALIDFLELKIEILERKNQLLQYIEKLKGYNDFLLSLI